MRLNKLGAHTKTDLKVHLIWIPKYRKKVLIGPVAIRTRDLLRQIALDHGIEIISGKVAIDHIHMLISYRPTQNTSKIMQWLKGISSRVLYVSPVPSQTLTVGFCCGTLTIERDRDLIKS